MKTYVALLRGINVGGHKKIKMTDLKLLFEELGFVDVMTYIQSGNVVFSSNTNVNLERIIGEKILERFGFELPVLVKAISEVEVILTACLFSEEKRRLLILPY